jgi:hypothetical protein
VEAVVAAPGALVGGLVVVEGVRPSVAAARGAERAGAAAAGMGGRGAAGSVALPAGVLFAGAAAGVFLLGALVGLLAGALAGAVGGLLAGIGAEAALAARVIGLAEAGPAGWAVAVDDPYVHGRSPRGPGLADRQAGSAPADAVGQPGGVEGGELAAVGRADESQHLVGVSPDLPGGWAGPPSGPPVGVGRVVEEHVAAGYQPASSWSSRPLAQSQATRKASWA